MNTCKVLELVEAEEIPVIKGAVMPLLRVPHYEHRVHGEDGFPSLTQVGLDVTRQVLLTDERIDAIQNETLASYIRESTSIYRQRYFERNGVWACAIHDPLAVSLAIDKQLVNTQAFHVEVETKSEFCDGQMICDFQYQWGKDRNLQVCMDVDGEGFFNLMIKVLNS